VFLDIDVVVNNVPTVYTGVPKACVCTQKKTYSSGVIFSSEVDHVCKYMFVHPMSICMFVRTSISLPVHSRAYWYNWLWNDE